MRRSLLAITTATLLAGSSAGCGGGGSSAHYSVDSVSRCLENHNFTVKRLADFGVMPGGVEGNLEVDDNGKEQVDLAFASDESNADRNTKAAKGTAGAFESMGSSADLVRQKGNVTYWVMDDTSQFEIVEQCLGS